MAFSLVTEKNTNICRWALFYDGTFFIRVVFFFFCWWCSSVAMFSILMWLRCQFLPLLLLLFYFQFVFLSPSLLYTHFHSYCESRFSVLKMVYFIRRCFFSYKSCIQYIKRFLELKKRKKKPAHTHRPLNSWILAIHTHIKCNRVKDLFLLCWRWYRGIFHDEFER